MPEEEGKLSRRKRREKKKVSRRIEKMLRGKGKEKKMKRKRIRENS